MALDSIDRKILNELQRDGRISNVELAGRVNLSPSPCLERVKKLESNGYIDRYVAHLNPTLLNAGMLVYIEVSLKNTSTESLQDFNQQILQFSEVVECVMVAGGFDYLIKIRAADMDDYRRFLGDKLSAISLVAQTHTYPVMEVVKSTHVIPVQR